MKDDKERRSNQTYLEIAIEKNKIVSRLDPH